MKNLIPHFIHDNFKAGNFQGDFEAVSIFVDISGFTVMTETLMQHGKEGGEILAETLQGVFTPLVNAIYAYGGILTGFAGDAFTAVFPFQKGKNDDLTYQSALAAAFSVKQSFLDNSERATKFGLFSFAVKIGIADGAVNWGILRSEDQPYQYVYFFRGPAIDACAHAEHHAVKGEIILSKVVAEKFRDVVQTQLIDENNFRVTALTGALAEPSPILPWRADNEVLKAFLPSEIVHATTLGEFRNVLTVFLSFEDVNSVAELNEIMQLLFHQIQIYRGTLTRIDFGDKGFNILVFWGMPVSFENEIERALNFLLDFKKDLHSQKTTASEKQFRAGVTRRVMYSGYAGSPLQGEYTCYGQGINLAARLMMKAQWGEFWLDEFVHQDGKVQFQIDSKGELEFKGFAKPVPAYSLVDRQAYSRAILYHGKMVGRSEELKIVTDFMQPILQKPRAEKAFAGVCIVYGEAGMGKSRLIYEIRQKMLRQEFIWWMYCPCDEVLRQSLNPFKYYLRNFFRQSPLLSSEENKNCFEEQMGQLIADIQAMTDSNADKKINDILQELERTKSILAGMIDISFPGSLFDQLEPKLRFENMLFAYKNFIKARCLLRPVIISIDDLQWMDADSHQMITTLTRNMDEFPLAILCTSRYFDDDSKPVCKVDSQVPTVSIDLNCLSDAGIRDIAEQVISGKVTDDVIAFIKAKTQGNPFFVEQLTLNLKERGGLVNTPAQPDLFQLNTQDLADMPQTINAVLMSRLDRLALPVKYVVQMAAILGAEFEIPVLQRMLELNTDIDTEIKAASSAAVWTALSEVRYIFKHALMRDAAYDMQLRSHLRTNHLRAAKAFEQIYPDDLAPYYSNLAHHYEKAEDVHNTMEYLHKAALRAKNLYQNQQALNLLDKLIDMQRAMLGIPREEMPLASSGTTS